MPAPRRLASIVLVAALLAGACGDDGDPSSEDALAEAIAADPRTEEQRAADRAAAEAALLTLADFPAGWEAQEPDPDEELEGEDELEAELAGCLGVDTSFLGESVVSAESDDFSLESTEVALTVAIEPDVQAAQTQMEVIRADGARSCFEQAFGGLLEAQLENPDPGEELPEGVEVGDLTVGDLAVAPAGEDVIGLRITIPMSAQGLQLELLLDVVTVRVGRAGATFLFQSVLTPVDPAFVDQLVATVASRLPAA